MSAVASMAHQTFKTIGAFVQRVIIARL